MGIFSEICAGALCIFLPFIIINSYGYLTPLASFAVTFAFKTLITFAQKGESPFGSDTHTHFTVDLFREVLKAQHELVESANRLRRVIKLNRDSHNHDYEYSKAESKPLPSSKSSPEKEKSPEATEAIPSPSRKRSVEYSKSPYGRPTYEYDSSKPAWYLSVDNARLKPPQNLGRTLPSQSVKKTVPMKRMKSVERSTLCSQSLVTDCCSDYSDEPEFPKGFSAQFAAGVLAAFRHKSVKLAEMEDFKELDDSDDESTADLEMAKFKQMLRVDSRHD